MKLDLEATGATLRLDTDDVDWCRVELHLGDRVVVLGAEMGKVVFTRLDDGLRDMLAGEPAGVVDGIPVRWVLSLAEQHCTFYAADVDEGRRLFIQDRDARWIAQLTLSAEQRSRWSALLRRST